MKLHHKGLILVSVPLVCEILFVLVLIIFLRQAEVEVMAEARDKAIVAQLNNINLVLYEAGISLFSYQLTNNLDAKYRLNTAKTEVSRELESLRQVIESDPDQKESFRRVNVLANQSIELLNEGLSAIEHGNADAATLGTPGPRKRMGPVLAHLGKELDALSDRYKKMSETSSSSSQRNRAMVVQCIACGVAFNVMVAAALLFYFSKGTARRLSVVADNVGRLARRETLNPELAGEDEIATIDHSFHAMASALRELDRLKREFVAMVTHDLKTPISSLQFVLDMLEEGAYGTVNNDGMEVLARSQTDIERLLKLVNSLLELETLELGQVNLRRATVRIDEVFSHAGAAIDGFAQQKAVTVNFQETDLEIFVDTDRMVQVMTNLISNAIKFAPRGSAVSVGVKSDSDECVELFVLDTGRGVPAQFQESIFERFKQVQITDRSKHSGTGLGLAICKQIVEQHGGSIGVNSEPGVRTTFWIRLPRRLPQVCDSLTVPSTIESAW